MRPSGTVLGQMLDDAARLTGFPQGTPVVLGGQDHLCGTLPIGAHRPGVVANIMGSWESLIATVTQADCSWTMGRAGVCVQAHVAPGRYAAWGGSPSASALSWFREVTGDADRPWEEVITEVERESKPGAGGVIFPALSFFRPVSGQRRPGGRRLCRTAQHDAQNRFVPGRDREALTISFCISSEPWRNAWRRDSNG